MSCLLHFFAMCLSLLIVKYSIPCFCTRHSLLSSASTSILVFALAKLSLAGVFFVFFSSSVL